MQGSHLAGLAGTVVVAAGAPLGGGADDETGRDKHLGQHVDTPCFTSAASARILTHSLFWIIDSLLTSPMLHLTFVESSPLRSSILNILLE